MERTASIAERRGTWGRPSADAREAPCGASLTSQMQLQLPVNGLQKQELNGGDGQNCVPQKKPHSPFTQARPCWQHWVVPHGVVPCGHAARHVPWKQICPGGQQVLFAHAVVPLGH